MKLNFRFLKTWDKSYLHYIKLNGRRTIIRFFKFNISFYITWNSSIETGTTDSTELFLLVSTSCSLLVFLLSIASLIYCHQKLTTLKVTETKTQQNNLYSVEEVNTDEDIENEPDETPEDPIYNSYEEPCYSILKLKVNRSSLCVMEQP
ncbi:uncharacterized protein LOC134241189 [Saccostrea cucullata]|uniref:uncharacterized protein LOC134241189 n=1 Tax=Saccostrea cuccullata TaxID=36930 RepID=UPI002ED1A802